MNFMEKPFMIYQAKSADLQGFRNPGGLLEEKLTLDRVQSYHTFRRDPGDAKSPTLLKVFDILGRKVATLVNRHHSARAHQARFNAVNLSGAMYIY